MELELEDALKRADRAEAELKALKPAQAELKDNLEDAKCNLEVKTLKRFDLQNQLLQLQNQMSQLQVSFNAEGLKAGTYVQVL